MSLNLAIIDISQYPDYLTDKECDAKSIRTFHEVTFDDPSNMTTYYDLIRAIEMTLECVGRLGDIRFLLLDGNNSITPVLNESKAWAEAWQKVDVNHRNIEGPLTLFSFLKEIGSRHTPDSVTANELLRYKRNNTEGVVNNPVVVFRPNDSLTFDGKTYTIVGGSNVS